MHRMIKNMARWVVLGFALTFGPGVAWAYEPYDLYDAYDYYDAGYEGPYDEDDWFFDYYDYDASAYDPYYPYYPDYNYDVDLFDWEEDGLFQ